MNLTMILAPFSPFLFNNLQVTLGFKPVLEILLTSV
jgi:hypothetical protein